VAAKTGRPEKLTAAVHARIVDAIRCGASRAKAAQAAGIDRSTLQRYLARGRGPNAPVRFQKFVEAFKAAEVAAYLASVDSIRQAADRGDWRAAAFMLERRHSDEFGRNAPERDGGGGGGESVHWDFSALTNKQLADLQALLEKVERREPGTGLDRSPGPDG
jgi:hypothetical protein